MRDPGSLHYFEVHAGFVHHTVNANNYTRAQVPGIIRGIYAYHTQTRGWSDVGYNFLVDRFGRIWEGRYGGVDRPVVGAHTLGYNDYAFAMSAIGNFETARPTAAMLDAYGKLFAWKLSLHGVDAGDTSQKVGRRTFQAINGHRDAGRPPARAATSTPRSRTIRDAGRRLPGRLDRPRPQTPTSSARGHPDILLAQGRRQGGVRAAHRRHAQAGAPAGWPPPPAGRRYDVVVASPDLTGDGKADLVVRNAAPGNAGVRAGTGDGDLRRRDGHDHGFAGLDQITAVGDLNERRPQRPGRPADRDRQAARSSAATARRLQPRSCSVQRWSGYNLTVGAGRPQR